jgi:hypothetical protein
MQMVGCGQARTGQIDGGQDGGYPPRRAGASLTICQCHDYPSAIYYYVTPAAACSSPVSTKKAAPVEEEKKWKVVWRIKLPQVFISEVLQWLLKPAIRPMGTSAHGQGCGQTPSPIY